MKMFTLNFLWSLEAKIKINNHLKEKLHTLKLGSWSKLGFSVLWFLLFSMLFTGCSVRSIVVDQLSPVVDEMQASILSESEEKLVAGSVPFAVKFAESLYRYYPSSPYYSGKLALLYSAYTFAYVDETPYDDFDDDADEKVARLTGLYDRAFNYGLKSLNTRYDGFDPQIFQSTNVDAVLAEMEEEDVETLFWFNFSWALKLFYNLEDVEALVHLETIKKIADRIEVLDPNYFFGINQAIFIAYYGGRSEAIGGDLSKAKKHYERANKLTKGKSLVSDFVYLRFVTLQNNEEEEFEKIYKKIIRFDLKQNPSFYFINQMIQTKAQKLYAQKDNFF